MPSRYILIGENYLSSMANRTAVSLHTSFKKANISNVTLYLDANGDNFPEIKQFYEKQFLVLEKLQLASKRSINFNLLKWEFDLLSNKTTSSEEFERIIHFYLFGKDRVKSYKELLDYINKNKIKTIGTNTNEFTEPTKINRIKEIENRLEQIEGDEQICIVVLSADYLHEIYNELKDNSRYNFFITLDEKLEISCDYKYKELLNIYEEVKLYNSNYTNKLAQNKIRIIRDVNNNFILKSYYLSIINDRLSFASINEIIHLLKMSLNNEIELNDKQFEKLANIVKGKGILKRLMKDADLPNSINKERLTILKTMFKDTTNLFDVVRIDDIELLKVLYEAGANLRETDENGTFLIQSAVAKGSKKSLEYIYVKASEPYLIDRYYLLHIAVKNKQRSMVSFLLEKGADPNVRDGYGLIPLNWAEPKRAYPGGFFEELISGLFYPNFYGEMKKMLSRNDISSAPVIIKMDIYNSVKKTVSRSIDFFPCQESTRLQEDLRAAAYEGDKNFIEQLLNRGVNINGRGYQGSFCSWWNGYGYKTPLMVAVFYNKNEVAKYLIDKGAR